MINTDQYILDFIKGNYISTAAIFYFLRCWAVAHKGVPNNSIFTLIAVTATEIWDVVLNIRAGRLPDCKEK